MTVKEAIHQLVRVNEVKPIEFQVRHNTIWKIVARVGVYEVLLMPRGERIAFIKVRHRMAPPQEQGMYFATLGAALDWVGHSKRGEVCVA